MLILHVLFAAAQFVVVRDDAVKPPMFTAIVADDPPAITISLGNFHLLTLRDVVSFEEAKTTAQRWPVPAAIDTRSVAIWQRRPDLSYEPAGPRIRRDEEAYVHFDVYAFLPGHEQEVEALTKEYVDVDRAAGVRHRWEIYEVVAGADVPALVLVTPARSRSDYEAEKLAADKLRDNRDLPLHARTTKLLRRIESFDGTIRQRRAVQRSLTTN